ncbi:MAG: UDP-N-acetylmuramoyl-L-alanine--D-glutamate ligase [Steroidobacteraceae bacterium]|nr:UDP-N-acetylmuramoyl-L-alanine--D-glutamate ligase [Nevskiaceae bacterium]MCP5360850.1 UDP-N-acetylmuramoyl-L-alanine--D-glutamate ligase [Nevskiaceae bacterium]MCP5466311.1 UDP-N-acetylmuramoyl-L-alanine--D-glutamate ligase [Nevskiaceae bacterium]
MSAASPQAGTAVIVGLGRSGVSAARHLVSRGWRIAVTDSRAEPPGVTALRELAPQAPLRVGGFDDSLLEGATLVVASPGVSLDAPLLARARALGLDVVGDIELFARATRGIPTIGITGTNGKSTVTTLVGRMAVRAGRKVRVGGNLGPPALELLDEPGEVDLYVLELSSFQLEATQSLELVAGVVLNVTADHLDRHADMGAYAAAKARIFAHCGTAVVNADDERVAAMPAPGQRTRRFSLREGVPADYSIALRAGEGWLMRGTQPLLPLAALKLAGLHNAANALASIALGEAAGLPTPAMLEELRQFTGLRHRVQQVVEIRGVRYIDDSKGTNVGATLAAVAGLSGTLVLIAGGDGKGQDFRPLAAALRGRVRLAVLIGRDAATIEAALGDACPVQRAASLEAAVAAAAAAAEPGDTVLLSPACASLDMFRDYIHRGEVFAAAARRLAS